MDGIGEHYLKGNEPDSERPVPNTPCCVEAKLLT
jgi:hypothetical protein